MGPFAQSDRHDAPWLFDEAVPSKAAVIEDVLIGFEDAVGEPVVAHELPDVFDRVEFWRAGRQFHERDIPRHDEFRRRVPAGLIDQDDGVRARIDFSTEL